MPTRRVLTLVLAFALTAGGAAVSGATAGPLDPPADACTDVEARTDPTCVPTAVVAHDVRQACDYAWLPGCEVTAFQDPGYATSADPSPAGRYRWRTGAVHEHSGYSDGDIDSIPRDYYDAARTGINATSSGVALDFLFSSEHSDNAQITPTTNATCITDPTRTIDCAHVEDNTFWWKWPASLRQAQEATSADFAAIRGFEWTNDFYNHMNVYFSTNFRNVKIDGSYLDLDRMWEWLQTPVAQGGGADGLVTFNHPGSNPKLSPFDGGFPHSELLASTTLDNWNEVAYVPAVDGRVVGMEVNGGEDIEWFVRALTNGWHIGPVAAEDHHERSWASQAMHKTMVLTKGSDPKDYYWAMANRRTVAVHAELVGGAPGTRAVVPTIDFTADGIHVLGSRVANGRGRHTLRVVATGLPAGSRLALVGSADGLAAPVPAGTVGSDGRVDARHKIRTTAGDWWFAVVCAPATATSAPCGTDHDYRALTAPIWFE
jgi:hypothetical protein